MYHMSPKEPRLDEPEDYDWEEDDSYEPDRLEDDPHYYEDYEED